MLQLLICQATSSKYTVHFGSTTKINIDIMCIYIYRFVLCGNLYGLVILIQDNFTQS